MLDSIEVKEGTVSGGVSVGEGIESAIPKDLARLEAAALLASRDLDPIDQKLAAWEIMEMLTAMKSLERIVQLRMRGVSTEVMAEAAFSYQALQLRKQEEKKAAKVEESKIKPENLPAIPRLEDPVDEVTLLCAGLERALWHTRNDGTEFEDGFVKARKQTLEDFASEPELAHVVEEQNAASADSDYMEMAS